MNRLTQLMPETNDNGEKCYCSIPEKVDGKIVGDKRIINRLGNFEDLLNKWGLSDLTIEELDEWHNRVIWSVKMLNKLTKRITSKELDEKPANPKCYINAEETCPVCGSDDIEYDGDREDDDNGGTYSWNCHACGAHGKEGFTRKFDGHVDVYDENDKLLFNYIDENGKPVII